MKGGKAKERCGDREEAKRFGYGSVATRFATRKRLLLLFKQLPEQVSLFRGALCRWLLM